MLNEEETRAKLAKLFKRQVMMVSWIRMLKVGAVRCQYLNDE